MYRRTFALLMSLISWAVLQGQSREDSLRRVRDYTMEEVVVTGTRNETDLRHLPMSVSVINREQIDRRYEQSLLPILTEQVPGFFATGRGILGYGVAGGAAGGMNLRGIGGGITGGPTTGLLVLIDGHPQYMGLMGHPIADAYQSMLAEKVEVVRGPASVLYGSNAMGGVINIVTRKMKEDAVRNHVRMGYGSYNTWMTEVSNLIRKGRFNSVVTASYNRTDGHRADMGFEQYGGYAKLGYELDPKWNAFADVNLTHFDASNPGAVTKPVFDNDSHVTRGMTSFTLENRYENTSGALKFFYNWGRHEINEGYSFGEAPRMYLFHSNDRMWGVACYQSASFFTGNRVTFGVDYQYIGGEAWNGFYNDDRVELIDRTEHEIAGYVDFRQAIGSILTWNAGVRADHHSRTGTEWIPQVGLAVHLLKEAELKAMISKGFRNPTLREMYMFPPQNPDLLPERLMNYELSWSHRLWNNALSYGLNLFYLKGSNMIQSLFVGGRSMNVNTGKIENWGVEANVGYQLDASWRISSNYSFLHMCYPVIAAPEHKLYAGIDFMKGKWNVSTGLCYVAGLYTSVAPDVKESFILWNLRGSYRLYSGMNLFVSGENLLAQRYEINKGYPMPRATVLGGVNFNF